MALFADINAIKDDKVWRGIHFAIFLLAVGAMGCLSRITAELAIGIMGAVLTTLWGIKLVLPKKEEKDDPILRTPTG